MDSTETNNENKSGISWVKHLLFLLIWWLSLGFTLDNNSAILGIVLSFVFFSITSFKVLKKSLLIMLAVFLITVIFPAFGIVVAILALIFFLLRISFVIRNWRALTVGLYAYGIYLLVVVFNAFFYDTVVVQATLRVVDFFGAGGETAVETFGQQGVDAVNATTGFIKEALHVGSYVFPLFLTIAFHNMLRWLYRHDYTTSQAFQVIGLTPLVVMALVLPFLKIDLGSDALFTGSLADGTESINLPHADLPQPVTTLFDVANIDVTGWFADNATAFSPAIESAVATMAVRGIYAVDKGKGIGELFRSSFGGTTQTVRQDRANHMLVTDQNGQSIAEISHDEFGDIDRAVLGDGQEIILDNRTGNITDGKGKILARIREIAGGNKILLTNDDRIIRTYERDGIVKNSQGDIVGRMTA